MLNLKQTRHLERWLLGASTSKPRALEPVERHGLKVMSVGFLIAEEQTMALPAPLLHAALRQLFSDVDWGDLDYLVVDLPPGTADLQQAVVRLVPEMAAIVVVGPQDVAHLDACKLVDMLRSANVRILGGVENMAGFACPRCGEVTDVFPRVSAERSLWRNGLEMLASIPLDPTFARGPRAFLDAPTGPEASYYRALADRVLTLVRPSEVSP